MYQNFNKNILQSIKIYNKNKNEYKNISITEDGYIYSFEPKIGYNQYSYSYLLYKNNSNIIKGPKNIINQTIIDSNEIIYFMKNNEVDILENKNNYTFQKFKYNGEKKEKFSFYSDRIKKMSFSKNGKFAITIDIFGITNLYNTESFKIIETIKIKYFECIDEIHISPDGKTVLITKNNKIAIWKHEKITTIPIVYKEIDHHYYGYIEVYFGNDDIIKLGFLNGSIVILKDGKIISKIIRNLQCSCNYFSHDGKILCCFYKDEFKFIHEDSDEYSNNISFIKNVSYNGKISPDGKLFISTESKNYNFVIYDISFIGYKKCQKLTFLTGTKDKDSNINSFSENVLFDINVVKLIFDFLPFSKEIKN